MDTEIKENNEKIVENKIKEEIEFANKTIQKTRKHLKLLDAYENNIEISDKNLGDKFTHFEDSKLDESKTLLFETNKVTKTFQRYSRGSIVRVKFGVNIGSEFSGDHFAIVISKGDTAYNSVLHIIPITSKKHKKSLNVGNILYNENEINNLKVILENETNIENIKNIKRVIKYYEYRKETVSYACIDHIKTVSKLSVNKTMFKSYDYLEKIKCNDELLKIIDECIIKEYTNSNDI